MPKFYSKVPSVSAGKIAGTNPIPGPTLGNAELPGVDQTPGSFHGEGAKHGLIKPVAVSHGYGHAAKHHKGHLRLSGHVGAHMLGKKK